MVNISNPLKGIQKGLLWFIFSTILLLIIGYLFTQIDFYKLQGISIVLLVTASLLFIVFLFSIIFAIFQMLNDLKREHEEIKKIPYR